MTERRERRDNLRVELRKLDLEPEDLSAGTRRILIDYFEKERRRRAADNTA